MLVQLNRVSGGSVAVNPDNVATVFTSYEEGVTIVRMNDGRGFKIAGSYADVMNMLEGRNDESPNPQTRAIDMM